MVRLEWIFFIQMIMGILLFIFLWKVVQIKKQLDEITKEVKNYITYITEEMKTEQKEQIVSEKIQKQERLFKDHNQLQEVQNSLIQAVLGEFFP